MVSETVTVVFMLRTVRCTMNDSDRGERHFQIVFCRAREGVEPGAVARLSAELQRWVERQRGFVSRRLVGDGSGAYVDIVEWRDRLSAEEAARALDHPSGERMAEVLAIESMTLVQGGLVSP